MEKGFIERPDLVGATGSYTRHFKVVDAKEYPTGVSVRISDDMGEEFWTGLEDVDLD